jgi:hypothetical protein
MNLGASKWERRFELERLRHIRGKCLAKIVYLLLHLRHRPSGGALFQYAHMANEEFAGVIV